ARAYVASLCGAVRPRRTGSGDGGRSHVYRGCMSDVPPFGFGLPDRDPERRGGGGEPTPGDPSGLGALFGGIAGGGSPEDLLGKMPLFAELQKLMNWSGGPV